MSNHIDPIHGFVRTTYEGGYKYTMIYPPGWTLGDPRKPEIHKEPCVPAPSNGRQGERQLSFEVRPSPERGHLPDRQPRHAAPPQPESREPVEVPPSPRNGGGEETGKWSYPLKSYLAQAWMPAYALGEHVDASVRYEWPFFRALVRSPGTRELYLVQRILDSELRDAIHILKEEALEDTLITSALVEAGNVGDLTLPDTGHVFPGQHDAEFLEGCQLGAPLDVTRLVQAYPLRTVLKAIRLFLDRPLERMTFGDVNHLCPVQNVSDSFDLIALPGMDPDELSVLMVVVPPWDFKYDDLEEFCSTGVPYGKLDLVSSMSPPPSDVIWAVIWDICVKYGCRSFVLTTYDEWVFGTLSQDMHRAWLTKPLRAPVFAHDMAVSAKDVAQRRFPVPNVFETLLLWILSAQDTSNDWMARPPDMPVPVHPNEMEMFEVERAL